MAQPYFLQYGTPQQPEQKPISGLKLTAPKTKASNLLLPQRMKQLIEFTDRGLYCRAGNFYIDPWKPVDNALITHGHSDHARFGSKHYLIHTASLPILQLRLGSENSFETIDWGIKKNIQGVQVSFHPAGHVIGSSQIRVEHKGEVWVVSGDYKLENDGLSGAFEPVKCNSFVTESTFGLPIYDWQTQAQIYADIQNWVLENQASGQASVLLAYSLGKAQRVVDAVSKVTDKIFVHGAVYNMHKVLQEAGHALPNVTRVVPDMPKETFEKAVIVTPSSAEGTPWMRRFKPCRLGICSGWMQVRGNVRRNNADRGFVLSDHCDWKSLLTAVQETGAEKVYVTHGFQSVFSKYLNEAGIESAEVKTAYGNEDEEEDELETVENKTD